MVACEVDDFEVFGDSMGLDELAGLSFGTAAEEDIDILQVEIAREVHVGLAVEALMDIDNALATDSAGVHPFQLDVGVVDEDAYQFACRVA